MREFFSTKEDATDFLIKSKACELLGIKVLDHIILGKNIDEYFSFLEEGLIK